MDPFVRVANFPVRALFSLPPWHFLCSSSCFVLTPSVTLFVLHFVLCCRSLRDTFCAPLQLCCRFLRDTFCVQVRALLSLRENFCFPLRTFAFLNRCTRMCRNHFSSRVVAGYAFYMLRQHSAKELPHEVSPSVTLFVVFFVLFNKAKPPKIAPKIAQSMLRFDSVSLPLYPGGTPKM